MILGAVLTEPGADDRLEKHLIRQAADVRARWPKLAAMPEWKGSILGRKPTKGRRRAIREGREPSRAARPAIFARGLAAIDRVEGAWAMAFVYEWTSGVTPASRGADYRLRRAVLLLLAAVRAAKPDFVITKAVIDKGHDAGYSAAFDEYFRIYGGSPISPRYTSSDADMRLQVADLVATAGKQVVFPSRQFFPGSERLLGGLIRNRLIADGANPYVRSTEP